MAIIVLLLLASSVLGGISIALSLLLNGYWWQAALLCLAVVAFGYLLNAADVQQFPEAGPRVPPSRKS